MTDAKPTKLDKLREKQRQLAEQIAAINSREKAGERKADTRRKILIGGAVLASYRHGDFPQERLIGLLDTYLTHDRDRDLFDFLPPRADGAPKPDQMPAPVKVAQADPPVAAVTPPPIDPPASAPGELRKRPVPNPSPDMKDYL